MSEFQLVDSLEFLPEAGKFYNEKRWSMQKSLWDGNFTDLEIGEHHGEMVKIIDHEKEDTEYAIAFYYLRRLINVQRLFRVQAIGDNYFLFFFEGKDGQKRKVCIIKIELYGKKKTATIIQGVIGGAGDTIFMPDGRVIFRSTSSHWSQCSIEDATVASLNHGFLLDPKNLYYEYYRGPEKDVILTYYVVSSDRRSESIYTLLDAETMQMIKPAHNTYDGYIIKPEPGVMFTTILNSEGPRIQELIEMEVSKKDAILMSKIRSIVT